MGVVYKCLVPFSLGFTQSDSKFKSSLLNSVDKIFSLISGVGNVVVRRFKFTESLRKV